MILKATALTTVAWFLKKVHQGCCNDSRLREIDCMELVSNRFMGNIGEPHIGPIQYYSRLIIWETKISAFPLSNTIKRPIKAPNEY